MATAKKSYPYAIYYNDGSYMIYDLTGDDFEKVQKTMNHPEREHRILECSIGILNLCDMRSIIKQKPPEKKKPVIAAHPELTMEDIEWLALNKEAWSMEDEEGGMPQ